MDGKIVRLNMQIIDGPDSLNLAEAFLAEFNPFLDWHGGYKYIGSVSFLAKRESAPDETKHIITNIHYLVRAKNHLGEGVLSFQGTGSLLDGKTIDTLISGSYNPRTRKGEISMTVPASMCATG